MNINSKEKTDKHFLFTEDELISALKDAYRHGYATYEVVNAGLEPYDPDSYARYAILKLK